MCMCIHTRCLGNEPTICRREAKQAKKANLKVAKDRLALVEDLNRIDLILATFSEEFHSSTNTRKPQEGFHLI